jgi:hypothetical protein
MQRQKVHALVAVEGPMVGERYALVNLLSTMGRASTNTIVLESAQISRLHAQIRLTPGGVIIEDMGSTNGTFVNGRRLDAPRTLAPGDLIRFAEFATLQYVVQGAPDIDRSSTGPGKLSAQVLESRHAPAPAPSSAPAAHAAVYEPTHVQPAPVGRAPQGAQTTVLKPSPSRQAASDDIAPRRSTWLYGAIIILLVLICLCVALAAFLWFAPVTFWERALDLLGIPLPSGVFVLVPLG